MVRKIDEPLRDDEIGNVNVNAVTGNIEMTEKVGEKKEEAKVKDGRRSICLMTNMVKTDAPALMREKTQIHHLPRPSYPFPIHRQDG